MAPENPPGTLLKIEHLDVWYGSRHVVHDAEIELRRGQSLALIGESGSGKSTITKAILGLLPDHESRSSGSIEFENQDLLSAPQRQLRSLRGRRLGYIPQDPGSALNTVRTVGSQAHEAAALTGTVGREAQRELIIEAFEQVGLPDPQRVYDAYPHQLSGGMLQRALIALTVLPRPALIIADEPTSALDVTVQRTILDLLDRLRREHHISLLLITHDLAIAAERADRLVVLQRGKVQESGPAIEIFDHPKTEYAQRLLADVPSLNPERYRQTRGAVPSRGATDTTQILVSEVSKQFAGARGSFKAVDDVSFAVARGTTHALVGESGSGKTTTIRMLLGLEVPDSGCIEVAGHLISGQTPAQWRNSRRQLQLVYQNPFTSLDPSWSVERLVAEPLARYKLGHAKQRSLRVREVLGEVGLGEEFLKRKAHQLSGGQRQRVAIARALAIKPEVLVLDEPTSALDVSVQADLFDLLANLQREHGLTYVFVSHDLALVRQIADTVSVLRRGRVVESGNAQEIFTNPQHAYTRELLDSIPHADHPESVLDQQHNRRTKTYVEATA